MNKPLEKIQPPPHIIIVGAGGGGSWLTPAVRRLCPDTPIELYDGDILETRNLNRQLYREEDVGRNKAEALADLYPGITARPAWFHADVPVPRRSCLLCCVDNNPARAAIIQAAEAARGVVIIGGNEYTEATADLYVPEDMKGTPNDPAHHTPAIFTDRTGAPAGSGAGGGCAAEAAVAATPQLVMANMAGATFMLQLLWFWYATRRRLERDTRPHWPVSFRSCSTALQTIRWGDREIAAQPQAA